MRRWHPIDELAAALAEHGQRTVLPDGARWAALAVGRSGIRRLGDGDARRAAAGGVRGR
ncbi:MAG: hypothetical protein R2713_23500 [Ilumatobacteraceae bacterium]